MTICDNGEHVVKERLPESSIVSDSPPRLSKTQKHTKLMEEAARMKPLPPYQLASWQDQCAHPSGCGIVRRDLDDRTSLCVVHEWQRKYGIEE